MNDYFYVTLSPQEAARVMDEALIRGSITCECIDSYETSAPSGVCIVRIYEKNYMRAGNRLTLTAVIDNFEGRTKVHLASGGGGEGLFRLDWGASESFAADAEDALEPWRL